METTISALPERVLYLCACAAWAAKGDLEHLETAIPQALDHGVTINELKARSRNSTRTTNSRLPSENSSPWQP
ncbi:MAG: hypothetical protein II827_01995 [Paludibacteraceae bacterium]|nr:hypothetical protein [Paludibacteraceae bacterium]